MLSPCWGVGNLILNTHTHTHTHTQNKIWIVFLTLALRELTLQGFGLCFFPRHGSQPMSQSCSPALAGLPNRAPAHLRLPTQSDSPNAVKSAISPTLLHTYHMSTPDERPVCVSCMVLFIHSLASRNSTNGRLPIWKNYAKHFHTSPLTTHYIIYFKGKQKTECTWAW